ncbi:MAG: hypothetical protein Q7R63_01370 [bacterium]|nr:hypothetical protein [bacterium]
MLSALPLFVGAVSAPFFFPHGLGAGAAMLFSAVVAMLFGGALGVKNLILIHREAVLEVSAYALAYVALLLFFMQTLSGAFALIWLYAVVCIWLSSCLLARDYRIALVLTTLMAELIWIVSWLPIGFLNSASVCFAVMLFAGDAVREKRISARNTAILAALIALIFITSHWRF